MPAVDFDLSPDHELIRRTVREFAEGEVAPVAEELDRTKSFPYEIVRKLGALNLMGIPFPEEYGGGGGDTLAYALAVEELTRVDSSVAITLCAHTSLGTQPIYLFGTEAAEARVAAPAVLRRAARRVRADRARGRLGRGNVRTRATLQDGEWTINGAKQFITNAGTEISGRGLHHRPHRRSQEISNLIVPNGTPGYEQGEPYRKMGWNASDTRPLTFSATAACPRRTCSARAGRASSSSSTSSTSAGSASRRWASDSRRARSTRR